MNAKKIPFVKATEGSAHGVYLQGGGYRADGALN